VASKRRKKPKRIKPPSVYHFEFECPHCRYQAMEDLDDRDIPYHVEGIAIVSGRRAYRLFKSTGRIISEG
jgi:hypothetical protein